MHIFMGLLGIFKGKTVLYTIRGTNKRIGQINRHTVLVMRMSDKTLK